MSLTQQQRQAVAQFRDLTNTSEAVAIKALKASKFKVDIAVDLFLSKSSSNKADVKALDKIFDTYAEQSAPNEIQIEGTIRYCADIALSLEDVGVLALAMLLQAPTQGTFTRSGFVDGWNKLNIYTLSAMQDFCTTLTQRVRTEQELYKRTYLYTFTFALSPPSRTLDLQSALVFWDLLLRDRFARLEAWKEFLERKGKGISRDVWNLLLDFSENVKDLQDYDDSEAWPVVMDDFVTWCKENDK